MVYPQKVWARVGFSSPSAHLAGLMQKAPQVTDGIGTWWPEADPEEVARPPSISQGRSLPKPLPRRGQAPSCRSPGAAHFSIRDVH